MKNMKLWELKKGDNFRLVLENKDGTIKQKSDIMTFITCDGMYGQVTSPKNYRPNHMNQREIGFIACAEKVERV
jgi:hypothetical protein